MWRDGNQAGGLLLSHLQEEDGHQQSDVRSEVQAERATKSDSDEAFRSCGGDSVGVFGEGPMRKGGDRGCC